jgi:hypothetical protein
MHQSKKIAKTFTRVSFVTPNKTKLTDPPPPALAK